MANEKLVDRIRKLLNKAEGTTNEHEAAAFMAKAQLLMAQHAIEEHELDPQERSEGITTVTVHIPKSTPGTQAERLLLQSAAKANRCVSWFLSGSSANPVVGFESDVEFTVMLYKSLSTQMASAFMRTPRGLGVHGRTWRTSFCNGYANEVSDRLMAAIREEQSQHLSESNALALRDRKRQVMMHESVPQNLRKSSTPTRSRDAFSAGKRQGRNADLSGGRNNLGGQKGLPRG